MVNQLKYYKPVKCWTYPMMLERLEMGNLVVVRLVGTAGLVGTDQRVVEVVEMLGTVLVVAQEQWG